MTEMVGRAVLALVTAIGTAALLAGLLYVLCKLALVGISHARLGWQVIWFLCWRAQHRGKEPQLAQMLDSALERARQAEKKELDVRLDEAGKCWQAVCGEHERAREGLLRGELSEEAYVDLREKLHEFDGLRAVANRIRAHEKARKESLG